jgi:ATP synthase protein I
MPPETDDTIKDLQERIAAQKAQAGMDEPAAEKATAEATNMQMGIKAGTEFVGSLLGGGLLGWLVDGWLDSAPIGLIAGVLVGIIVAFWNLYKLTLPPASTGLQ